MFLICLSSTPVAWVQIAALLGGAVMIVLDKGRRRALAITVVTMIFLLHFYYLLHLDNVLGRGAYRGYHYIYWTLFPWCSVSAVAGAGTIVRVGLTSHAAIGAVDTGGSQLRHCDSPRNNIRQCYLCSPAPSRR